MVKTKRQKSLNWCRILSLFLMLIFISTNLFVINCITNSEYSAVKKKVEIQSPGYIKSDPGSWHIDKSAEWTGVGKARVTFDVDTNLSISQNKSKDVILVLDVSGSMDGDKLKKVQDDAEDLIKKLLGSDTSSKIALVSFSNDGDILSNFSNDKNDLINKIKGLSATGSTNYYGALVKVETILTEYVEQDNNDLVTLFLTDGYPNTDFPLEVGQYQRLKARYPDMEIKGIQYELGVEITQELKNVSEEQYHADMSTLHSVLFEALDASEKYKNFQIVDYIDTDYFTL